MAKEDLQKSQSSDRQLTEAELSQAAGAGDIKKLARGLDGGDGTDTVPFSDAEGLGVLTGPINITDFESITTDVIILGAG